MKRKLLLIRISVTKGYTLSSLLVTYMIVGELYFASSTTASSSFFSCDLHTHTHTHTRARTRILITNAHTITYQKNKIIPIYPPPTYPLPKFATGGGGKTKFARLNDLYNDQKDGKTRDNNTGTKGGGGGGVGGKGGYAKCQHQRGDMHMHTHRVHRLLPLQQRQLVSNHTAPKQLVATCWV